MNSQGLERDQCERRDFTTFAKSGVHVHVFRPVLAIRVCLSRRVA